MATDRTKEIDIVDMKRVALGVGVEPRAGRMLVYPNNGTLRFRDDNLQTRSITPNTRLIIVGVGGDYTTLTAAVTAAPNNAKIRLMEGIYVGDITFAKTLYIEGEGSKSVIDGNLIFNAGSDYSYVTNCNIRKNITFNTPSKYTNVVFNWISPTSTVIDNNIVSSVSSTYRLFALASQTFAYYATASAVQQTFAEYTGSTFTHAATSAFYDTYAQGSVTTNTIAYADTMVSTNATASTTYSAFAKATRISNAYAFADTTYQVRASASTPYNVRAAASTTYSTKATKSTTSNTIANGNSTFSTYAFNDSLGTNIFTADTLGATGNSISLIFDGVQDVNTVVSAWNGAPIPAGNTVAYTGPGTTVPSAQTINLIGGSAGNAVKFTADIPGATGNSISLVFDGTATLDQVATAWNTGPGIGNEVSHDGNPDGVPPVGTVALAGGTSGNAVTFTAQVAGISGNSISIPFDGVLDLITTVTNWNDSSPASSKVNYTGVNTSIVPAGNQALAGATSGNAVTFTAVTPGSAGNSISLVFDGIQDIATVVTAGGNQVTHNGVGTGVVNSSTVPLTGGVSNATSTISANTLGTGGNGIALVFNGTTDTLTSVTTAWNSGAGSANPVSFTGNGAGVPTAGTKTLAGGVNATAVRFQCSHPTSGSTGNTVALVFDGIKTIDNVVTQWNAANPDAKDVTTNGPADGIVPAGTLTLSGGKTSSSYTFTANTIGANGNLISLVFDGISTLTAVLATWNIPANAGNHVSYTGSGASDILTAQTVTLSGGTSNTAVTFTADKLGPTGNTVSLVFNGTQDISTVVNTWNTSPGATGGNTVSHNGNPLGIVTAQTLNLSGGSSGTASRIVAQTPGLNGNSISLIFNGTTDTTTSVINAWNTSGPGSANKAAEIGGVAGGIPPAGTITLAHGTNNSVITFKANELGVLGNDILLQFDGIIMLGGMQTEWNDNNPNNTVTITGDPLLILPPSTQAPTGGLDAVPFKFAAINTGIAGNGLVITANGTDTLGAIVTAWNLANPEDIRHDGVDAGVPLAGTYTLAGGTASAPIYFKASTVGVTGNSITLTFDGIRSIAGAMKVWNDAPTPPGNTVTTTSPTTAVPSAQVITLSGGAVGATVIFTAVVPGVGGNNIILVMDGVKDTNTVVTEWNNAHADKVTFTGNPTGVVAASTIPLVGGKASVPVIFMADNLGTIGNTIVLVFDGVKTLKQVVDAWNAVPANNLNRVHHNGVDSFVPYAITLNLAGGLDATPITFTSLGGQGFTLIFDGARTVYTVVEEWNNANKSSQVNYSGRPGTEPGIVPASILRLAIGGATNMYILTQE